MSKKLVVFGSFGFGNVGDEAVPLAIQDILERKQIDCKLEVVSRYRKPDMEGVVGLSDLYVEKLEQLSDCPVVLSGGGIIEPHINSCIMRFGAYRKMVRPDSASIVAGSFEYGVTYNWRIKRHLRKLLGELDKVYTRDYLSEIYFQENFRDIPVSTIGDIVLGMLPASYQVRCGEDIAQNEYIAVSLCGIWNDDPNWYSWIVSELALLSNSLDKPIVFVSMSQHFDDDRIEHSIVANHLKKETLKHKPYLIEDILTPREVARVFKDAYLAVSMRLHGCVMSYAQRTPFVGLAYHPKLLGFAQTVGWKQFLLPGQYSIEQDHQRYGHAFSAFTFRKSDLLRVCNDALEFGDFNLLPLFIRNQDEVFTTILGSS